MKVFFMSLFFIIFLFANELSKANQLYLNKKYKLASKIYEKLSKQNNPIAINRLAMMYYEGKGVLPAQGKAVKLFEKLLDLNITKRQKAITLYNLGVIYFSGYVDNEKHKLIMDRKKAKYLLLKAMKLGYKPAKIFYDNKYTIRNSK